MFSFHYLLSAFFVELFENVACLYIILNLPTATTLGIENMISLKTNLVCIQGVLNIQFYKQTSSFILKGKEQNNITNSFLTQKYISILEIKESNNFTSVFYNHFIIN